MGPPFKYIVLKQVMTMKIFRTTQTFVLDLTGKFLLKLFNIKMNYSSFS